MKKAPKIKVPKILSLKSQKLKTKKLPKLKLGRPPKAVSTILPMARFNTL